MEGPSDTTRPQDVLLHEITMSKDKQTMALENYDIEPVRLTEVRIEK